MKTKMKNDLETASEELRCAITNVEDGVGWKRHFNKAKKIIEKYNHDIHELKFSVEFYGIALLKNGTSEWIRKDIIYDMTTIMNEINHFLKEIKEEK